MTFTDVCMAGWQLLPANHTNVCKLDLFQKGMSPSIFNILLSYLLFLLNCQALSIFCVFICQANYKFSTMIMLRSKTADINKDPPFAALCSSYYFNSISFSSASPVVHNLQHPLSPCQDFKNNFFLPFSCSKIKGWRGRCFAVAFYKRMYEVYFYSKPRRFSSQFKTRYSKYSVLLFISCHFQQIVLVMVLLNALSSSNISVHRTSRICSVW